MIPEFKKPRKWASLSSKSSSARKTCGKSSKAKARMKSAPNSCQRIPPRPSLCPQNPKRCPQNQSIQKFPSKHQKFLKASKSPKATLQLPNLKSICQRTTRERPSMIWWAKRAREATKVLRTTILGRKASHIHRHHRQHQRWSPRLPRSSPKRSKSSRTTSLSPRTSSSAV